MFSWVLKNWADNTSRISFHLFLSIKFLVQIFDGHMVIKNLQSQGRKTYIRVLLLNNKFFNVLI